MKKILMRKLKRLTKFTKKLQHGLSWESVQKALMK